MKDKNKAEKVDQGSGLIFAVVLLFVILGMVVTLASVTMLETKMNQKTKSSVGAFYNSESGVEWALNKISISSGTISGTLSANSDGSVTCPISPDCKVYFLKSDGTVITKTDFSTLTFNDIKAIRSIGTQGVGGAADTQRAIEAAVASGGGGCYFSYGTKDIPAGTAMDSTGKCLAGFTNKGNIGSWGYCFAASGNFYAGGFRPPGGICQGGMIETTPPYTTVADNTYLCCQ